MSDNKDDIFLDGLDAGDWIVKAHPKVPIRKFDDEVPQGIVDLMERKYSVRLDGMFDEIEKKLQLTDFGKARLVIYPGSKDDLFKAAAGPRTAEGRLIEPDKVGSKGGIFYRNKKGKVVYGKEHPGGDFVPATDKEVEFHARTFITPTIFVGHNKESYQAFLDSGYFEESDLTVLDYFRNKVLKSKEVLGNLKDYNNINDIVAKDFQTADGLVGAPAVVAWTRSLFLAKMPMTDDDDNPYTPEETEKVFKDLLQKYTNAHKDPKVLEAIKQNAIRHQIESADANGRIKESKALTVTNKILDRLISPTNLKDASLEALLLMRQIGLLFTVTSTKMTGKLADARMLGHININQDVLLAAHKGDIKIGSECSPAQAIAFVIAQQLSSHQDLVTGDYDVNAFKMVDGDVGSKFSHLELGKELKASLQAHFKTSKIGEALEEHYVDNICRLGTSALEYLNAQHKGGRSDLEELMKGNALEKLKKGKDAVASIREAIQQNEDDVKRILDAAQDDKLELPESMKKGEFGDGGKKELFPHQKKAVNWMKAAVRGILAYGVGMGKTGAAIAFIEHMKAMGDPDCKRGVLFLPPNLIGQWISEIKKAAPNSKILNLSNFPTEDRHEIVKAIGADYDYILVSKGLMTGDVSAADQQKKKKAKEGMTEEEIAMMEYHAPANQALESKVITALNGMKGNCVLIDEFHQGGFKDPKNSAHALCNLALEGAKYGFGMTATPVPNSADDLYHLTELLAPGTVGSHETWKGRLAQNHFDPKTGNLTISNQADLKDLNERIRPRMLTGNFNDPDVQKAMADRLPPAPTNDEPENVTLPLDVWEGKPAGQISQYDYVMKAAPVMAYLRVEALEKERIENGEGAYGEGVKENMTNLLAAGISRQCSISPALVDKNYTGRHPKIEKVGERIAAHFAEGGWAGPKNKGCVVFSNFNKSFHLLKKELAEKYGIDPSLIGEIHSSSGEDRDATKDAFNAGHLKIVMVGTMAGGAGLNLQASANHVFHIDSPYTASAKEQCNGRVLRTGQEESTMLSSFHVTDSYDERLVDLIRNKGILGEALTAKDFDKTMAELDIKNNQLGAGVRPRPTQEEMEQFQALADTLSISAEDLDQMTFDRPSKKKGDVSDPTYHNYEVNEKAKAKLPAHLRTAFDRKKYEEDRDREIKLASAHDCIEQHQQALNFYTKKGEAVNVKKYTRSIEDLKNLIVTAAGGTPTTAPGKAGKAAPKPPKAEAPKPVEAPEEAEKPKAGAGQDHMALINNLKPSSKMPGLASKKQTIPYQASDEIHDAKRDKKMGAEPDFHLSGNNLRDIYSKYKKLKPANAKEFAEKILAGTGLSMQKRMGLVKQVLHHFHKDKLI